MHKEDSALPNQRADNDLVHPRIKAWTCDS